MGDVFSARLRQPRDEELSLLTRRAGFQGDESVALLTRIRDTREGVQRGHGDGRYVPRGTGTVVAWWTDARGERWVRVVRENMPGFHFDDLEGDARPPLWHVAPGRVFGVSTAANPRPRWVVACDCGEVGPPEDLLWMGDRCGPCHDRREEAGLPDDGGFDCGFGLPTRAMTFAPDGRGLYVAQGQRLVYRLPGTARFDPVAGAADSLERITSVKVSPSGRCVASTHPDSAVVRILDTVTGVARNLTIGLDFVRHAHVTFATDDDVLFCLGGPPTQRWRRDGGEWTLIDAKLPSAAFSAVAPDGRTAALSLGRDRLRVIDIETGRQRCWLPRIDGVSHVDRMRFGDDGRLWLVLADSGRRPHLVAYDPLTGERAADVEVPFVASGVWFGPCGRYLLGTSGTAILVFDITADAIAASLEWHPRLKFTALAFSPDGRTLAAAAEGGGVVSLPWRELFGLG